MAESKIQNRRQTTSVYVPSGMPEPPADGTAPTDSELPGTALARLLQDVADDLPAQIRDNDPQPQDAALELLARIAGPDLRLSGLDPTLKSFVLAMPPEAWQALQRHAQASGGGGITSVRLGAELSGERGLVRGLKELQTLKCILVSPPAGESGIDFGDLQGPEGQDGAVQLERVILQGDAPRGLWFKVPVGVSVEARGQSRPGLWRSLVYYTDSEGNMVGVPRPVHGQIHDNEAVDFRKPADTYKDDPQIRANEVKLNLRVERADGDFIMCRRLAAQMLNDLMTGRPVSFAHYATTSDIERHVLDSVDSDIDRMIAQGSCALYRPERFGEMMEKQYDGMRAGESRLFALTTGGHMLALQLLVTGASHGGVMRRENVLKLYDPTFTAKHEVITFVGEDLSPLRAKSLADFCVDKHDVDEYFSRGKYFMGSLYRWPPGPARKPDEILPVSIHASEEDIATGGFLYAALEDGHAALVKKSMLAMKAQPWGIDKSELAAVGGDPPMPGLYRAVSTASPPEVVAEYVHQLLQFESRTVNSAEKLALLQAESRGQTVLHCALTSGHANMVQPFVGAVLAAPNALTRGDRYKLLLSTAYSGQPMLSELCAARPSPSQAAVQEHQYDAMHAYLKEIVNSQALSDAEKESLVSAYGGPAGQELPAAKLALNSGNPGAAAAMLLAILESSVPPALRTRLLEALGVKTDEVLSSLSQEQRAGADQVWRFDTILRIEAFALA